MVKKLLILSVGVALALTGIVVQRGADLVLPAGTLTVEDLITDVSGGEVVDLGPLLEGSDWTIVQFGAHW